MVRTASSSDAKCRDPSCRRAVALLRLGSLRMTVWGFSGLHSNCDWEDRSRGGTNGIVIGRKMHRSFGSPSLRFAQARLAQDDSLGWCVQFSGTVSWKDRSEGVVRKASSSDAECIGPSGRRAFALLMPGSLRMTGLGVAYSSLELWLGKTGMRVARTASSSDAECIGPSCRRAFALLRLGLLRMTAFWER